MSLQAELPATAASIQSVQHCRRHLEQGAALIQRGDLSAARACFEEAVKADAREAIAYNCLGIIARLERRFPEAIRLLRQAIVLKPHFAEAHNNLGNVSRDQGAIADAESCYRHAISLKPEFPEAQNNLGVVCLARGAREEAIRCFEKAISLQPRYGEAYNNLANAFREQGEYLDAAACLRSALQLCPTSAEIHANLGNVLMQSGEREQARQHFQQSLELDPNCVHAHLGIGNLLLDAEQLEDAIECYRTVCATASATADCFVNLGNVLRLTGQTEASRTTYVQAAALEPRRLSHQLRVAAACPVVFQSRDEMQTEKNRALGQWDELAGIAKQQSDFRLTDDLPEPSFNWQFLDGNLRDLKEAYARIFDTAARESQVSLTLNPRRPKIGIVVSKGHEGLFVRSMRGVLNGLADMDADLVFVALGASEQTLRSNFDHRIDLLNLPQSVERAAGSIRECRFDVLYYWEIGTDASNYFLPFLRLAPVQCTSWGIQVTSGIPTVDYYLSSRLIEPEGAQDHYTERLLLASTLLTFQARPPLPANPRGRESLGVHPGQHLYVCAQQPGKFHPDFDNLLAGILENDEKALIVATGERYGHATRKLSQRLSRTLGDFANRVQFLPRLNYSDYLNLLWSADVLLDPPHFGGVNSTYDALAMNRPMVTWPSGYHRGEYTAGCYRKMGMQELLANSADQYVGLAVRLASDADFRKEIRRQLAERTDVLFEDGLAIAEHKRLFEQLISTARRGSC